MLTTEELLARVKALRDERSRAHDSALQGVLSEMVEYLEDLLSEMEAIRDRPPEE